MFFQCGVQNFIVGTFRSMVQKALVLSALSVVLILFKNRLKKEAPTNPQTYRHNWNFYRHCEKFVASIDQIVTFLDLRGLLMLPDVHLLTDRFVKDLICIREDVLATSQDDNLDVKGDFGVFFDMFLQSKLEKLYTTICDVPCSHCDG